MEKSVDATSGSASKRRFQTRVLLLASVVLHLLVTSAVFTAGRYQLSHSQISPTGIGKFASDGFVYQEQVVELSKVLKNNGVRAWAGWPIQLHVRLYALPFTAISRWVSFNILTIEPVNLIYYLAILILVFRLGVAMFTFRAGMIAATIVALWPSFLMHTTQLLRDPLLILCMLIFVWSVVESLRLDLSWRRALLLGVTSVAAIVLIRIVRLPMWYLIAAAVAVATGLLLFLSVVNKRIQKPSLLFAFLIVTATLVSPKLQPFFRTQQGTEALLPSGHETMQSLSLAEQISLYREMFKFEINQQGERQVPKGSSLIDAQVTFHNMSDIIRQLPRALEVGYFAPFPNMWLKSGEWVGSGARLLSGFEMVLTYVIELFALFGLWNARRNLAAWFLVAVISLGTIALGLVVDNVGTLYRMRYSFWMLIVVLGAGGFVVLFDRFRIQQSEAENPSGREVPI